MFAHCEPFTTPTREILNLIAHCIVYQGPVNTKYLKNFFSFLDSDSSRIIKVVVLFVVLAKQLGLLQA
jgi:hypothetical protein